MGRGDVAKLWLLGQLCEQLQQPSALLNILGGAKLLTEHPPTTHTAAGQCSFPLHRSWHLQLQLRPSSCWKKLRALPEPGSERCAQGEACGDSALPGRYGWHAPAQVSVGSGCASCLASNVTGEALPHHPSIPPPMVGVEDVKEGCEVTPLPGKAAPCLQIPQGSGSVCLAELLGNAMLQETLFRTQAACPSVLPMWDEKGQWRSGGAAPG